MNSLLAVRRSLTPDERSRLNAFSDISAHLLYHRGCTDNESAARFVSPDYDRDIHDPRLLKDAEKAAERIRQAMLSRQKIAIYADYDADGIPGAVIWNDFFRRAGFEDFSIYIPHRHNEGFGLNKKAVDALAGQGVRLLITLDCGITDVEPVAHAAEKGMDVIITDHHEPPPQLPPAYAIVDHKQADCSYPDKNLCGSGVAFKLIQAVLARAAAAGTPLLKEGHEKWLLDMVGIATLSDMVPLTGENRALAHYGLAVLRKSPRLGLVKLLAKLKISQKYLTEDDVAFMITPRINAASRMGAPRDAFNLLAAATEDEADACAAHLEEINTERKGVVAALVKEIKKTIRERHGEETVMAGSLPSVIVLGNPEWRPSLLGLAANSCAEEFSRPVFLWGRDGDNALKGSCRSEGRTHVVELMRAAPAGTFAQFGGHRHSGGFAVAHEAVHFLEQRLNEAALQLQTGPDAAVSPTEPIQIDAQLTLDEVTYSLWDEISRLAPFGIGNPKPVFLFKNVSPVSVRRFGKANDHLELSFMTRTSRAGNGGKISAISFFEAESPWAQAVQPGMPIDLVASLEKSFFRGRPELRLRIVMVSSLA